MSTAEAASSTAYSRAIDLLRHAARISPPLRDAVAEVQREVAHLRSMSINAAHIDHQADWSATTFGPGPRTKGVVDHIRKELKEIEQAPTDLDEWVDVIILGFDGAWRTGAESQQIIDAIKAKQARNEARVWPDWRTSDPDKAIEHDRSADVR